jgi:hypothetical protein
MGLVSIAGILMLLLIAYSFVRRVRYYSRFDPDKLVGLPAAEVQRVLGPPAFVMEDDQRWLYHIGRTPGPSLTFENGRLKSIEGPSDSWWEWRHLGSP